MDAGRRRHRLAARRLLILLPANSNRENASITRN